VVVVLCLTLSYTAAGGLMYCLGLMQGVWIQELNITTSDASLINSVTFAITLLPAPAIQAARDHFKIPPFLIFALTVPLVGTGLYMTSVADTFKEIMISNGIIFGLGILFAITGSLTTVYHFFLDDKVTLATSIISSGIGVGMIIVAMSFKYFEPHIGWREYCRWQIVCISFYLLATVIFFPPLSRFLGIRTRKYQEKKLKKIEKLRQAQKERYDNEREREREHEALLSNRYPSSGSASQHGINMGGDVNEGLDSDNYKVLYGDNRDTDPVPSRCSDGSPSPCESDHIESLITGTNVATITDSIKVKSMQLWKEILTNPCFLLLMVSWLLAEATFNAVMMQQPQRIVFLGYSLQNGADTLAISGAVQIFARFGCGFLADRKIVSIARLSQISKVTLGSFSILSNIFTSMQFQNVYMFLVGACGGMLSTTDFILVKDCVTEGRELGITVLLLVDGIFSLVSIAGAGYLFNTYNNYDAVFYTFGAASLLSFVLLVLMEIIMKHRNKRHIGQRGGYVQLGN